MYRRVSRSRTSEQFHSELKTDMNIEKLPSGKCITNALILNITVLAFNYLWIMGQRSQDKPQLLHQEYKAARRGLRSVMKDLIYIICKVVKHADIFGFHLVGAIRITGFLRICMHDIEQIKFFRQV